MEALDERALPSITLTDGLLEVVGSTSDDWVSVTSPSPGRLRVTMDSTGEDRAFNLASLSKILIRVRAGDDIVDVAPNIQFPVEVRGWAGNDQITGGSGDDILLGGGGEDFIDGGEGHDTIIGQDGADFILGGNGNDYLYGDFTFDNGRGGADWIDGGAGSDSMFGGLLDDSFVFGQGDDQIDGGADIDQYYNRTMDGVSPTLLTSDVGLPIVTDSYWQTVDFDPYAVGGFDDSFGGYGNYWSQFESSDPFSSDFFDYSDYDYWEQFDLSDPFTPGFFDNLFEEPPVLGDDYRPVRVIADDFVLTTGDSASSIQEYEGGYRIRVFQGAYQESSGYDYSDGYGYNSSGSSSSGQTSTVSITYDDNAEGKEHHR